MRRFHKINRHICKRINKSIIHEIKHCGKEYLITFDPS